MHTYHMNDDPIHGQFVWLRDVRPEVADRMQQTLPYPYEVDRCTPENMLLARVVLRESGITHGKSAPEVLFAIIVPHPFDSRQDGTVLIQPDDCGWQKEPPEYKIIEGCLSSQLASVSQ